jgi:hypothetical protein
MTVRTAHGLISALVTGTVPGGRFAVTALGLCVGEHAEATA